MTLWSWKRVEIASSDFQVDENEYLGSYNELLSLAAVELGDNFAAIANPTLSKQETVTHLYEHCINLGFGWAQKLQTLKFLLQFPLRLCWHGCNLIALSYSYRVRALPVGSVYLRSWLVPQSFVGDSIEDEYFHALSGDLRRHENVILALQPLGYKLAWKLTKQELPDGCIIPIGLLSFFDVFRCMLEYLMHAKVSLSNSYILRNKEIRYKINISLLNDYLGMRSFLAYQEKYIARKLIDAHIKSFVYVFENQSWEKAYCYMFEGHGISTIGYQSSGFSKRFLNFFPNKIDCQKQRQPHVLLTVGKGFAKYLSEFAYYKSKIAVFAALRFDHPVINRKYSVRVPSAVLHRRLLYAFPVHLTQYERIINILTELFQDSSIEVHLKFHPINAASCEKFINRLPQNFCAVEQIDNHALSEKYDAVLFNDNSYGIEALMYGVKCFDLDLFGNSLDERLIYFDAWQCRIDTTGLRNLRDSLEAGRFDKSFDQEAISEYVNFLYSPYVGDLSIIHKAINAQEIH